jgi:hypothetical protein
MTYYNLMSGKVHYRSEHLCSILGEEVTALQVVEGAGVEGRIFLYKPHAKT